VRQALFEKYFILKTYFRRKVQNHAKKRSVTRCFAIYFIAAQEVNMPLVADLML
jgi:hypothetical protein